MAKIESLTLHLDSSEMVSSLEKLRTAIQNCSDEWEKFSSKVASEEAIAVRSKDVSRVA